MVKASWYWVFGLAVFFVIGPFAGSLIGGLRDATGATGVTPLTAASAFRGVLMALGVIGAAAIVGVMASRMFRDRDPFTGVREGLKFAGIVVGWAAFRAAAPDELVRRAQSAAPIWKLAAEGAVFGVIGIALCMAIASLGASQRSTAAPVKAAASRPPAWLWPGALVAGVAAGGVVAWFLGTHTLKLQAIAAATIAGVAVGAVVDLVLANAPDGSSSVHRPLFAGGVVMTLLACAAPFSAIVAAKGSAGVVGAAFSGHYFGAAAPAGLDWLTGMLIGVPAGVSWASSMVDKKATETRR